MHQMICTWQEILWQEAGIANHQGCQHQGFRQHFADQAQLIENMAQKHHPVQKVGHGKDKVPSAIMHTEEQLMDNTRLRCSGDTALGFHKAYNLGVVTASVSKHLPVNSATTGENPTTLGPVFLKANSTFDVHHQFYFSKRSVALTDTTIASTAVVACDDDKMLKKVIKKLEYPLSRHSCL